MNDLALPDAFRGRWQNLLIITYNADIPFFERAIWPQLANGCRNKIILADGRRFLQSSVDWVRDGTVRHLNQLYLGAGIFTPQAAHAKLVLLTNEESGRLLVGSGNLSMGGYASGGEVFSQYEYNSKETDNLSAFVTIREFLTELLQRDLIPSIAQSRITALFENTPWLYQSSAGWQPVRHNLDQSFLAQFQAAIRDDPVDELWLHAPFHDLESKALAAILNATQPKTVHLLVQPGQTLLNPDAVGQVRTSYGKSFAVHEVRRRLEAHDPYIHAKFYLAQLRDRAVCLHGSPNLSQVALLLTPPQGNIELANLLVGERDAFDAFLDGLRRQPFTRPLAELRIGPGEADETEEVTSSWYLTAGEWNGQSLTLHFRGLAPDLQQLDLRGATGSIAFAEHRQRLGYLEFVLSPIGIEQMKVNPSVSLQWRDGDGLNTSNPIFVCNRASLNRVLEAGEGEGGLASFGALDLEDEELEQLLGELDASFPVDRRSIWQMAGRAQPASSSDGQEELHLSYADINRDALRRHPRMQQYFRAGKRDETAYTPTRLQIVLNMISAHFQKLQGTPANAEAARLLADALNESDAENEEEREEEEAERQHRRISLSARIRRLMHNFIERFLHGLQMLDFQEFVGHLVMAQNTVIFQHLLWRLFYKEWSDQAFLIDALLRLWGFLWAQDDGYLAKLERKEREEVLQVLREHRADGLLTAGVFHSIRILFDQANSDELLRLRDFVRGWLSASYTPLSEPILHDAWTYLGEMYPYTTPLPSDIAEWIKKLCRVETDATFLRGVESQFQLPDHSSAFVWERVHRNNNPQAKIRCLKVMAAPRPPSIEEATRVLAHWMAWGNLDYYRANIVTREGQKTLIFFDVEENSGIFRQDNQNPLELTSADFSHSPNRWMHSVDLLRSQAEQVEELLTMPTVISVKQLVL